MMIRTTTLLALAQAAIKFSQAAADVAQQKEQLSSAYFDWRDSNDKLGVHIVRDDENWVSMMVATSEEYRLWQNAKSRKYRAEKKLMALAGGARMDWSV